MEVHDGREWTSGIPRQVPADGYARLFLGAGDDVVDPLDSFVRRGRRWSDLGVGRTNGVDARGVPPGQVVELGECCRFDPAVDRDGGLGGARELRECRDASVQIVLGGVERLGEDRGFLPNLYSLGEFGGQGLRFRRIENGDAARVCFEESGGHRAGPLQGAVAVVERTAGTGRNLDDHQPVDGKLPTAVRVVAVQDQGQDQVWARRSLWRCEGSDGQPGPHLMGVDAYHPGLRLK